MPITRSARYGLKDFKGGEDITITTNWNKNVYPNKYLHLQIGEKDIIVSTEELKSILLLLVDEENAVKLAESIIKQVKKYKVQVTLQVPRDARKGEKFTSYVDILI